eukprot:m.354261 g.354261  ORF g.354261 m.354261 type:complete len:81 (+) comp16967_c0_seq1:843-1085(+)
MRIDTEASTAYPLCHLLPQQVTSQPFSTFTSHSFDCSCCVVQSIVVVRAVSCVVKSILVGGSSRLSGTLSESFVRVCACK